MLLLNLNRLTRISRPTTLLNPSQISPLFMPFSFQMKNFSTDSTEKARHSNNMVFYSYPAELITLLQSKNAEHELEPTKSGMFKLKLYSHFNVTKTLME
jgi:hypothetical protein